MAKKSTEIVKIEETNGNSIISFDNVPDYLTGEQSTGMEGLGQSDFKIPRIKLLQPLSPEVRSFSGKAIPGHFWHTGANVSLGDQFNFVCAIASKRVILWNPREEGGGMLAFSRNGKTWDTGANKKFTVKIKGVKEHVIWETGKDVQSSGLLEWGTYNPDDDESGPAAQVHYEYLLYLPDRPELSPVVMGVHRTGSVNAKQFNTSLLMLRKPIQSVLVRCFADEKVSGDNAWYVPNFSTQGYVPLDTYKIVKHIADEQANYNTTYEPDGDASTSNNEAF